MVNIRFVGLNYLERKSVIVERQFPRKGICRTRIRPEHWSVTVPSYSTI